MPALIPARGPVEVTARLLDGTPVWSCTYRHTTAREAKGHAVRALKRKAFHEPEYGGVTVQVTVRSFTGEGLSVPYTIVPLKVNTLVPGKWVHARDI